MATFWVTWIVGFVVLAVFAAWLGSRLRKSVWGIFIDSRNTWSLSQFQLVLWTFVGLPLIIATAVWRATGDASKAWDFTIPGELLALMGISLGSAVTSLAIKSTKDAQRGDFVAAREPDLANPPFQDMFAVEEGASALKSVDVTKLQNFIITISLLLSYVWMVVQAMSDLSKGTVPTALPAFSQAMVGLLALSHGGYLVGKIPNREGDPSQPQIAAPIGAQREGAPPVRRVRGRPSIVTVASLS